MGAAGLDGGGGVGFEGELGAGLAGADGVRLAVGAGEGSFGTAPQPTRERHTNNETRIAADFKTHLLWRCGARGGVVWNQLAIVGRSQAALSAGLANSAENPFREGVGHGCGLLQLRWIQTVRSVAAGDGCSNRASSLKQKISKLL